LAGVQSANLGRSLIILESTVQLQLVTTINSQNLITKKTEFDAFISYYEETGKDYAQTIKRCFETRNIKTFVAHIERSKLIGEYERIFDQAIMSSKYFVLLITLDALTREQVIREVKTAYPTGLKDKPQFLIFRHNLPKLTSYNGYDSCR
jgi:hypothetical protein